jgi:hypothetical protein
MADADGCPAWQESHEDQCGSFKVHADVATVEACKTLCAPDALGPGKPCMALMYSAELKTCNIYEEQNGCPTGQEHPPPGYQQLLKMCPESACQMTAEGVCEMSTTGWVFVAVLLLAGLVYVGAGTAYNAKTKGLSLSAEALPHRDFWTEIQGLCADGLALVIATAKGERPLQGDRKGAGGYIAVPDAVAGGAESEPSASATVPDVAAAAQRDGRVEASAAELGSGGGGETGSGSSSSGGGGSADEGHGGGDSSDDEIIE